MSARPRSPYVDQDEVLLILSRWQRQSEQRLLDRLYGAPEAGEELDDEDAAPDPTAPRIPTADDEYAWASALGREDD